MTERSNVVTNTGATLAISATLPETYDQAGYESTDLVFTPIGSAENHGNHGPSATIVEFTPVNTGVVAKMKGSINEGTMTVMLGNVPGDAGQTILKSAVRSTLHYSLKVTYPLGDGESTHEVHYLDVLVSKYEYQDGAANDVRKVSCEFAVSKPTVIVPAS